MKIAPVSLCMIRYKEFQSDDWSPWQFYTIEPDRDDYVCSYTIKYNFLKTFGDRLRWITDLENEIQVQFIDGDIVQRRLY